MSYVWQPVGEWIEVLVAKSRRINVLGFLHPHGTLRTPFVFEGEVVIVFFDTLCQTAYSIYVGVLDKAPQHTS